MKRIMLFSALGALMLLSAPAWAFGVKDVVKMSDAGVPDSLIVMKIENSGKTFKLSADDITQLHNSNVSNEVISAMLQTEGRDRDDDYYGGYYSHPYPYYYDYPYSSRLYLGFGYRYGGRHYYSPYYGRGYYPRRYQPYSGGNFGNTRYRGSYGTRLYGGGTGQHGGGTTGGSAGSGTPSRSGGSGGSGGSGTRTRTR